MLNRLADRARLEMQVRRVRRGHYPGLDPTDLAATYRDLAVRVDREVVPSAGEASLLDYRVAYSDLRLLRYLFEEIFLNGEYWFASDRGDPKIVDCGSNIGISILYFKQLYPEARIRAFEPSPSTFELLRKNVERNNLRDVELHDVGLAGRVGSRNLYEEPGAAGNLRVSFDPSRSHGVSREVWTAPLSLYVNERVDLLKMDIEGSEMEVLEELEAGDRLRLIDRMIVEYHHHIENGRDQMSRILALLERNGFGYQVRAIFQPPVRDGEFQDVLLHAYRR